MIIIFLVTRLYLSLNSCPGKVPTALPGGHPPYPALFEPEFLPRKRSDIFIPSVLSWEEGGITLIQDTEFPFEEKSEIILELDRPSRFALNIRIPDWLNPAELSFSVNGEAKTFEKSHSGFASITGDGIPEIDNSGMQP